MSYIYPQSETHAMPAAPPKPWEKHGAGGGVCPVAGAASTGAAATPAAAAAAPAVPPKPTAMTSTAAPAVAPTTALAADSVSPAACLQRLLSGPGVRLDERRQPCRTSCHPAGRCRPLMCTLYHFCERPFQYANRYAATAATTGYGTGYGATGYGSAYGSAYGSSYSPYNRFGATGCAHYWYASFQSLNR